MTSLALDHRVRPMDRVRAVTRVLFVNPQLGLAMPLLILASAFVVNVLVFASIGDVREEATTGGLGSIYISQFIMGWIGVHQGFSFLVGLNVTRRVYWTAAVIVAVTQSLLYSLVLLVAGIVERATDGWGLSMNFFDIMPLTSDASLRTYLVYAVPLLFVTTLGLLLGAVTKRFGPRGFFLLSIAALLVIGGAVALIGYLGWWPTVGAWLADRSLLSILIGWTLVPTALAIGLGWLILRRAVP